MRLWFHQFATGIRRETADMGDDLRELAAAHWQLAEAEVRIATLSVRRFAWFAGLGVMLTVAGLPLLALGAVEALIVRYELDRTIALVVAAMVLVATGLAVALQGYRRCRQELSHLTATLAELREDAALVREWLGRE